ncbi:unnamed protein product [Dicrocoelium dendriticum]|nr:unnamed protein product [Dicrocoelium dendriticum]
MDKEDAGPTLKRPPTQKVVLKNFDQQVAGPSFIQPETINIVNAIKQFRSRADGEFNRLKFMCVDWNGVLTEESDTLPQSVVDSIRAVVEKCQLVLQYKLTFFLTMLDHTESTSGEIGLIGVPVINPSDLEAYWTLIVEEIAKIDALFDSLCKWRDEWHWDPAHCPITPPQSVVTRTFRNRKVVSTPKRMGVPMASNSPVKKIPLQLASGTTSRTIPRAASEKEQLANPRSAEKPVAKRTATTQDTDRSRESLLEVIIPLGLLPVTPSSAAPPQPRLLHGK